MNTKTKVGFTPGPWKVQNTSDNSSLYIIKDKVDTWYWVADAHGLNVGVPLEERDANSKLIAAAPEMFELLRKGLEDGDPMNWDAVDELLDKIKG